MKTFLRIFFSLMIIIAGIAAFSLTPTGLRVEIRIAEKMVPGKLSIQKISGVIIGPMTLQNVHYENANQIISIAHIHFNWYPADLWHKHVHIGALDIEGLHIITKKNAPQNDWNINTLKNIISTYVHSKFILSFIVDQARIRDVEYVNDAQQSSMHLSELLFHMNFAAQTWDTKLFANATQPTPFKIAFAILGNKENYHIHFLMQGKQTHLDMLGHGDLHHFNFITQHNLLFGQKVNFHAKLQWDDEMMNGSLRAITSQEQLHITITHHQQLHVTAHLHVNKKNAALQDVRAALTGTLNNNLWNLQLHQLTVAFAGQNQWTLQHPTELTIADDFVNATPLCLASHNAGNICVEGKWQNKKINAKLKMDIHHFAWLHRIVNFIRIPQGQLLANITIAGKTPHPIITGDMQLQNGNIEFPRINVTLRNINARLSGKDNDVTIDAKAYSQNQPIDIHGTLNLFHPNFSAEMQLTSNNVNIINTEEYVAYVTSDLKIKILNNHVTVTGNIVIPKASIQPNDYKPVNRLPTDVIYVGEFIPPPKPFWITNLNVNVAFGNEVNMCASNVTAQLGGQVQLLQKNSQPVLGNGKIVVRKGTYEVYGQKLILSPDSFLSFSDSLLDDPTLNVTATKTIESINNMGVSGFTQDHLIVGIQLTGSISKPKISFFSNRSSLSQADILSYLFLGYSNSSGTAGDTDLLLRALAAVNISSQGLLGKQNLATQIQSSLGLSELGVESETTVDSLGNPLDKQSAFVVGKHLTRRLYMRYSFGLSATPVNVFELRYLLSHHWAVQTDASANGQGYGADLLYTISKK